jgi:hypothetical protein
MTWYLRWTSSEFDPLLIQASSSCVTLQPDSDNDIKYKTDDALPEPRVMANFIVLPDGNILNINGARIGEEAN